MIGIIVMLAGIMLIIIYYAVRIYIAVSERFMRLEDKIKKLEGIISNLAYVAHVHNKGE